MSFAYLVRTFGEDEKQQYLDNAIKFLNNAENPDWKTPIKKSDDGKYRIYFLNYPNIYIAISPCNVNKLGLEMKLTMKAAQRLSILQIQDITHIIQRINKVTESQCTIYKE